MNHVQDLCCWLYLARLRLSASCWARIREAGWQLPALFSMCEQDYAEQGIPTALYKLLQNRDQQRLTDDLAWLDSSSSHHVVTWTDADYPPLLRHIPDPPPLLFARGQRHCLGDRQFAVVGSRRPDAYGIHSASSLARQLSVLGWTITSGLAQGVDGRAHRAALDAGGRTVAVLGNGLGSVYPRSHRALASEIAGRGLLLSELPPEFPPLAAHFPRRNRIISGMSVAVLVVQAARRSGSLITARQAAEQGREVFAVPGPVQNPLSEGCHALIRQGARLVDSGKDILEDLPDWALPKARRLESKPATTASTGPLPAATGPPGRLLERMGYESVSVEELVATTGLNSEAISSMLVTLELEGSVTAASGGRYLRVR